MTSAQPYRWAELPRTTRAELLAWRTIRRFVLASVPPEAWVRAVQELLGVPFSVTALPRPILHRVQDHEASDDRVDTLRSATPPRSESIPRMVSGDTLSSPRAQKTRLVTAAPARDGSRSMALVLATGQDSGSERTVIVEMDGALVAEVVARGLRRTPPGIVDVTMDVPTRVGGAFAAIVATSLRRSAPMLPFRVVSVGPAAGAGPTTRDRVHVALSVRLGDEVHAVQVCLPTDLPHGPSPGLTREALRTLAAMPLALPVVGRTSQARAEDVATLSPGDVWLPGGWTSKELDSLTLCAPRAERGVTIGLNSDGHWALGGEAVVLPWENSMKESGETLLETVADVPVVVRVEVGTAEMKASEWAALGPGDVVELGRKVGEHVVLRAGGVEIAQGELVELEGELGVRILRVRRGEAGQ